MKKNVTKGKKDWNKILLITMLILLILEIVLIPCLIYAELKKILPIVFFILIPTVFGIILLMLSKNCTSEYQKKKERLSKKK